jgi:hypothetical protein
VLAYNTFFLLVGEKLLKLPENNNLMDKEKLAEEVYDYCCAARSKDKKSPREVGREFSTLMDPVKEFYRFIAEWHLNKKN